MYAPKEQMFEKGLAIICINGYNRKYRKKENTKTGVYVCLV